MSDLLLIGSVVYGYITWAALVYLYHRMSIWDAIPLALFWWVTLILTAVDYYGKKWHSK